MEEKKTVGTNGKDVGRAVWYQMTKWQLLEIALFLLRQVSGPQLGLSSAISVIVVTEVYVAGTKCW